MSASLRPVSGSAVRASTLHAELQQDARRSLCEDHKSKGQLERSAIARWATAAN